jgi:hypothetical protein
VGEYFFHVVEQEDGSCSCNRGREHFGAHAQLTGVNWADAAEPLEASRQARVVASFAEYLAEDVHGHPERAPEAIASLAEWCEGDAVLLARARADVLRDTREAHAAVAENNREAAKLLELVASA